MIKEIVKVPNAILKQKAEPVIWQHEYKDFIRDLFDTLWANKAIGIAAPQIGLNRALCIVGTLCPIVLINPKIIADSGDYGDIQVEGCLSIPDTFVPIKRFKWIKVAAMDECMMPISISFNGPMARVAQHEIDHLNGILISDYEKSI